MTTWFKTSTTGPNINSCVLVDKSLMYIDHVIELMLQNIAWVLKWSGHSLVLTNNTCWRISGLYYGLISTQCQRRRNFHEGLGGGEIFANESCLQMNAVFLYSAKLSASITTKFFVLKFLCGENYMGVYFL